jgi:hypothetical protein
VTIDHPEPSGGVGVDVETLERLASATETLRRRFPLEHVECFHRGSDTMRVTRRAGQREHEVCRGRDDGTAIRLRRTGERAVRFAALTGAPQVVAEELASLALETTSLPGAISDRWVDEASPVLDEEQEAAAPSVDALAGWLDAAIDGFVADRAVGDGPVWEQAWIEVATTVEHWAVDGRAVAARSRRRGWAVLRRAAFGERGGQRPLIAAARRWDAIDPAGWVRLDTQRAIPRPFSDAVRGGRDDTTVVFRPEPAAMLVSSLVRGFTAHGVPSGTPVGAGFVVWDDPSVAGALFGGRCDDSGFPVRRKLLADGRTTRERIEGPGHDRRPSFRDPPLAGPSHLVVEAPRADPPPDAFHVHRLSIQPLATDRWVLDVAGSASGAGIRQAAIVVDPVRLVRGCVAGFGESASSHRGVTTPALAFEGLTI